NCIFQWPTVFFAYTLHPRSTATSCGVYRWTHGSLLLDPRRFTAARRNFRAVIVWRLPLDTCIFTARCPLHLRSSVCVWQGVPSAMGGQRHVAYAIAADRVAYGRLLALQQACPPLRCEERCCCVVSQAGRCRA